MTCPNFLLLKGFFVGLLLEAPIGTIGALTIQRIMAYGAGYGFISGLGAVLGDTFYGLVVGFGLVSFRSFLFSHKFFMNMFGAALVGYFGYRTFLAKSEYQTKLRHSESLLAAFMNNFFLTIANPIMFLSLTAVLAISGATHMANTYYKASCLIGGIFVGSMAWWICFSYAVSRWRHKITNALLQRINEFSGLVIMTYAAVIIVLTFYGLRKT
jgi:threonine/homoserine/homoserine lactone efflux protein